MSKCVRAKLCRYVNLFLCNTTDNGLVSIGKALLLAARELSKTERERHERESVESKRHHLVKSKIRSTGCKHFSKWTNIFRNGASKQCSHGFDQKFRMNAMA